MQDEAMDVARSAPQGAHYHADVFYLLPYLGIKREQGPYGTPRYSVPDQQSLYTDEQHTLAFYIKRVPPVGPKHLCYTIVPVHIFSGKLHSTFPHNCAVYVFTQRK